MKASFSLVDFNAIMIDDLKDTMLFHCSRESCSLSIPYFIIVLNDRGL